MEQILGFRAASTDDTSIASFVWRKGTDIIGTTASIQHTFSTEGVQNVSLEITDTDGTSASKDFTIYAFEGGAAGLVLHEPSQNVVEPETGVEFFASDAIPMSGWPKALILQPLHRQPSADGLSYSWRINDVEISTSQTPQIAFTNPGQTKISLVVTDGENILAKASRPIAPDLMSCGPTYLDEGIRCLTIPGVHSYVKAPNGTDFEIPFGEDVSEYEIERVILNRIDDSSEDNAIDVSLVSRINNATLTIPKNALLDNETPVSGSWWLRASLKKQNGETFEAELPYFVLESSTLGIPPLGENESLSIRDLSTGMHIKTITSSHGSTATIPATELEVTMISSVRKPILGSFSAAPKAYHFPNSITINGSEFDQYTFSTSPNSSASQSLRMNLSQVSTQSSSGLPLSWNSGIVAFNRSTRLHFSTEDIGPDYNLSSISGNNGSLQLIGKLKGSLVPWNEDDVGSNPALSNAKTIRHVYCSAYEEAWNKTSEIERLNSYYQSFLTARRHLIEYENDFYAIASQINAAKTAAQAAGFDNCDNYNVTGDLLLRCHIDFLVGTNIDLVVPAAIPHLRKMESLWFPYLHQKARRDDARFNLGSQEISYFTYGNEIGLGQELQSATWRRFMMPDSSAYIVIARFKEGDTPRSIEAPFSSSGLRGSYQANIHASPRLPINTFDTPGVEMKEIKFEFPANATGIEFEIRAAGKPPATSRIYIPNSNDHATVGHSSIVSQHSSASCKLAPSGYTVQRVEYDVDQVQPRLGELEWRWHVTNFARWSEADSVESLLSASLEIPNRRFSVYAARSVLRNAQLLPADLDKLAATAPNPLRNFTPEISQLSIPTKIFVAHQGLERPQSLEISGKYGNNTIIIANLQEDEVVSNANRSIYRVNIPYSAFSNHLSNMYLTNGNTLVGEKYQLMFRPVVSQGMVTSRKLSLTPLFNARYTQFLEAPGASLRSQYSSSVSAFVDPTMVEIVKVLDEVGNQVSPKDFYHNDGSLPFGQKLAGHKGHNTGRMLDVRTFNVRNSNYDRVDNKEKNALPQQLFTSSDTKFADLAKLMKMSYHALEYNNRPSVTTKLKTAAQCQIQSSTNPPSCAPDTELTIEKCLIAWVQLNTTEPSEMETACANVRSHVEGFITRQEISDSHSRYRDYILRNRQALLRFKELVQERGLTMPMIMYSHGSHETSGEGIAYKAGIPLTIEIDNQWNIRALKDGVIPQTSALTNVDSISIIGTNSSPIGSSPNLPYLTDDRSYIHLDHYHIQTTGN